MVFTSSHQTRTSILPRHSPSCLGLAVTQNCSVFEIISLRHIPWELIHNLFWKRSRFWPPFHLPSSHILCLPRSIPVHLSSRTSLYWLSLQLALLSFSISHLHLKIKTEKTNLKNRDKQQQQQENLPNPQTVFLLTSLPFYVMNDRAAFSTTPPRMHVLMTWQNAPVQFHHDSYSSLLNSVSISVLVWQWTRCDIIPSSFPWHLQPFSPLPLLSLNYPSSTFCSRPCSTYSSQEMSLAVCSSSSLCLLLSSFP